MIGKTLKDTSLAQTISDKRQAEFEANGVTTLYNCLHVLHIIVAEADSKNDNIYYENNKNRIIICDIPSLSLKHGTDFDRYGMQNKLRGLAEKYTDDNGNYIVSVLTTNDLNSAIIKDIGELLYQMK